LQFLLASFYFPEPYCDESISADSDMVITNMSKCVVVNMHDKQVTGIIGEQIEIRKSKERKKSYTSIHYVLSCVLHI